MCVGGSQVLKILMLRNYNDMDIMCRSTPVIFLGSCAPFIQLFAYIAIDSV